LTACVLDTDVVIAALDRRDKHHREAANAVTAMLEAGGTLRHKELLAPFGLDASDPAFWSRGLGLVEDMVARLEAELAEAPG
jgi:oligoendopeptidase F